MQGEVCLEGLPIFSWKYMKLFRPRVWKQGKVKKIEMSLFPKLTSWGIRGRTRAFFCSPGILLSAIEHASRNRSTNNEPLPHPMTSYCIWYISCPGFLHARPGSYKDYQCIFPHFRAQHDIVRYQLPLCSPRLLCLWNKRSEKKGTSKMEIGGFLVSFLLFDFPFRHILHF